MRTAALGAAGVWVLVAGLTTGRPAAAPGPDYTPVIEMLHREVPGLLTEHAVPGAAVALVDDQAIVWAGGFGVTDRTGAHPVTADTLFSIQSISKTYTAAAFMRAAGEGLLALDAPLTKALPGFTVHSRCGVAEADAITFRHLLAHWSGLCHEAPVGNNYGDWHCTFDEHVRSISDTWLKCRVGERFRYSNLGYDLVGSALQARFGRPFERFMREELLEPLGMRMSTFDQEEALQDSRRARGHIGEHQVPALEVPMLAAGGMYSTARDMARFVSFALADGEVDGRRVVSAEALRIMRTPQFCPDGPGAGYGLGVESRPFHGATLVSHGGGGYGYSTDQRWVQEDRVGVVVLSNSESGDNFVADLADRVLRDMIRIKRGRLEPEAPRSREPVVAPGPEQIRRLEGTYLVGAQLTSFRVENGRLHAVRGSRVQPLDAHGADGFSAGHDLYEFLSDAAGAVRAVRSRRDGGVTVLVRNDGPGDAPGPARPEWGRYLGVYRARAYGLDDEKSVGLKNGHLYWNDRMKLTEHAPGLFFTADGDSVRFGEDTVEFMNRHYRRTPRPDRDARFPGASWETIDRPEAVGWASVKLERARAYAGFIDTAALVVVVNGRVLCSWGDVSAKFMAHSMRKSLLSALYGCAVEEGRIRLDETLAELGIDDAPPLTDEERRATVRDLLRSRSGVYHAAALETADMAMARPARGSHPPGSHWHYNNWDFNALGTIYERRAGARIFESFGARIATPLEMEDFLVADGQYQQGPESQHPGYPLRISARDLARFGLLYLCKGAWNGRQIVPAAWIEESTRASSATGAGGYGYMWWVEREERGLPGIWLPPGTYWAWGTRGHYLVVIPAMDVVIVHRVNTDVPGKEVSHKEFGRLLRLILDARE